MAPPADEYPYNVIPTISNCQAIYSAVKFFWLPAKHTHTRTLVSLCIDWFWYASPLEGRVVALGISF
jgi:hypothetical protein